MQTSIQGKQVARCLKLRFVVKKQVA